MHFERSVDSYVLPWCIVCCKGLDKDFSVDKDHIDSETRRLCQHHVGTWKFHLACLSLV